MKGKVRSHNYSVFAYVPILGMHSLHEKSREMLELTSRQWDNTGWTHSASLKAEFVEFRQGTNQEDCNVGAEVSPAGHLMYTIFLSFYHPYLLHQSFPVGIGEAVTGKNINLLTTVRMADMTQITKKKIICLLSQWMPQFLFMSHCSHQKLTKLPLFGVQRGVSHWGKSEEMKYWCCHV